MTVTRATARPRAEYRPTTDLDRAARFFKRGLDGTVNARRVRHCHDCARDGDRKVLRLAGELGNVPARMHRSKCTGACTTGGGVCRESAGELGIKRLGEGIGTESLPLRQQ